MNIQHNVSLQNHNTFGINVNASKLIEIQFPKDLVHLFSQQNIHKNYLVLGSGSNILFSKDFDNLIIKMNNSTIQKVLEDSSSIHIKADAGVVWDDFVDNCTNNQWHGLENLSLIPGTVGASPVQNIGAFGVEAKDFIFSVDVFNTTTGSFETLSNKQCCFGYRDSIFKQQEKNNYIVTSVTFQLHKTPKINLTYEALKKSFPENYSPSPIELRNTVIQIRESKLPNINTFGNAGSFFKNPVIDMPHFKNIHAQYPDLVFYEAPNNMMKLAAGWLIEKTGWKGYIHKNAGVHEKQALVLINRGNAKPTDILELAAMIETDILKTFGVVLEKEVIVI